MNVGDERATSAGLKRFGRFLGLIDPVDPTAKVGPPLWFSISGLVFFVAMAIGSALNHHTWPVVVFIVGALLQLVSLFTRSRRPK